MPAPARESLRRSPAMGPPGEARAPQGGVRRRRDREYLAAGDVRQGAVGLPAHHRAETDEVTASLAQSKPSEVLSQFAGSISLASACIPFNARQADPQLEPAARSLGMRTTLRP